MPYFIDDKNCVRKGTKDEPGEVVKCHEEHAAAAAHLKALYANVEDAKGSASSGWYNPPQGTHTAENAPNFRGGPGADREYGTERDEPEPSSRRCKCSKCGAVVVLPKGKQCEDIKCPSCGAGMTQTEPREDKPAEGEEGRKPEPGRKKSVEEDEMTKQETHQCTCPECGATVQVPLGQKCNEVRCPKCKAMMKQRTPGTDETNAQEKAAVGEPGPTVHGQGGSIGETARVMDDGDGSDKCKCPHCGKSIPCTAKACPYCKKTIDKVDRGEGEKMDEEEKADWSAATVNNLPDSAFLYVESGEKDDEGKTTPRSKRHLPYKDASGKVDLPHLRNALSRLGQSKTGSGDGWLTPELRKRLQSKAQGILSKHGGGGKEEKSTLTVYKSASGVWRWLSISNWAVVDKEAEVVSEQAYRDAIAHAQKSGDWGQLDLVHVAGTDVGDCDQLFVLKSEDEPAKFGAGGTWYDTNKATRAREAIQADPAQWGVSIKFRYNPRKKVKGVYTGDIQVLKHSILPQHMAASYGTAIAVQGGEPMSKQLDDKAAEALRQLGHTEDEIAELAEKAKALPEEENVVEKEDTTGAEAAPLERSTIWKKLGKLLGIDEPTAPVASEPEEARKADEVTDPASTVGPAEEANAVGTKAEGGEPDAEGLIHALGETVAKAVGEMVRTELDVRDKRIAALEGQLAGLSQSVEEKVEQRLADLPQVVKVAASQVAATAVVEEAPKGLTFGNPPQESEKFYQDLLGGIEQVVKDKVARQFQV